MLRLSSNAEQTFASHNSINMNPKVYAEWNYNNIFKPYSVISGSVSSASTLFTSSSNFTFDATVAKVQAGNTNYTSGSTQIISASSAYVTPNRSSTDSIRIISTPTQSSDSVVVSAASALSSTLSNYYKLTFYVKSDVSDKAGTVQPISGSDLKLSASSAGTTYYFQVIPVSNSGNKPSFAMDSTATTLASDTASSRYPSTASPTISFPTQAGASEYDIYVSDVKDLPKFYKTVDAKYAKNNRIETTLSNKDGGGVGSFNSDIVKRTNRDNEIFVSTKINLYNGSTLLSDTSYYVKFYNDENSEAKEMLGGFYPDTVLYNKVEVYFGSLSAFTNFQIEFGINSLRSETILYFDKFEIVPINSWIYDSSFFFPIDGVSKPSLLGESLLNPLYNNKTFLDGKKKPISYGYYNPDAVVASPIKKNIMISKYNTFKYYVSSDVSDTSGTHYVSTKYDQPLTINKLIFKFSNYLTYVSSATIKLRDKNGNQIGSDITMSGGSQNDYEYLLFYYNGATWQSTGTFTPPELTDSGIIKDCVQDVASIECQFIVNNVDSTAPDKKVIKNRLHLIEISPRLEINISSLTKGFNIDKTIDSQNSSNGFPIGYMNSNSARLQISNIPVYNNGLPYTIFSDISERATFKDLLREGVKISANFVSSQQDFTDTIPAFVMYANKWSLGSLDQVEIDLYDIMKYNLMAIECPQYASMHESAFDTILNLFAAAGFSDFDYDLLKSIFENSAKQTTYFWTDIQNPLFTSLQSFFISHQIGAWIDEYGVLNFKNLNDIVNSYKDADFRTNYVNFAVTDKTLDSIGSSSITYIPNLIQDGFSYEIEPKPGKIIINYKVPTVEMNLSKAGETFGKESSMQEEKKVVWEPQGYTTINRTPLQDQLLYQNEFMLSQATLDTPKIILGSNKGEGVIGGEVVSWDGMEYSFYQNPARVSQTSYAPYKTIIKNESDVQTVIDQLRNQNSGQDVFTYKPTGRVVGVSRGRYGTQVQKHLRYKTNPTAAEKNKIFTDPDDDFAFRKTNFSNASSFPAVGSTPKDARSAVFTYPDAMFKTNEPADVGQTVLKMVIPAKTHPVVAIPKNFDASRCNFYSIKFKHPFDTSEFKQIGFYFSESETISSPTGQIYVGLHFNNKKTSIISYTTSGNKLVPSLKAVSANIKSSKMHEFSIYISGNNIHYYVNGYYKGYIEIPSISQNKIKRFGTYFGGTIATGTTFAEIYQIYAAEWATPGSMKNDSANISEITSKKIGYHFMTEEFLSNIVNNIPNTNKYYFWESQILLRGLYRFDSVDFAYKPIIVGSIYPSKPTYDPDAYIRDFMGNLTKDRGKMSESLDKVTNSHTATSLPSCSPFKFSFAIINNSPNQLIYLSTPDKKIGEITINSLNFYARTLTLSVDRRIERNINSRNLKQSIQIDSAWVQSERDAETLSEFVKVLTNTFNSTITVKMFGNPLIQVGDFCQLVYSLREIGYSHDQGVIPRYFFVKGVKHDYSSGFSTELVLKPMFDMS